MTRADSDSGTGRTRSRAAVLAQDRPRPDLTVIAWATLVVVSAVPEILWIELAGAVPTWWRAVIGVGLVGLVIATLAAPRLRPLRDFAVVMATFVVLMTLSPRIHDALAQLDPVLGGSMLDTRMRAEQLGKLAVTLTMMGVLVALGYRRQELYLARGDLHAPITPVRALGFPHAVPWSRFALQWSVYIAVVVALGQWLVLRPDGDTMLAVASMAPSILVYAAVNAVTEELTYRAPLLATLGPVVGGRAALWQSAVFFGVAHYFGTPGGLGGAAITVFLGWLLAKAMLETRGLFWAWWIHFLSDVAIFTFLTAALV
ncbi:CPBP family intramembrane glutamic endopeptidase [Cellulomonas sp. P5_C5]